MTDKAEVSKVKSTVSGRIKSRVAYNVTYQYNGRDAIIAPRQEISIPDFSKLGKLNPREVIKIED